MHVRLEDAVTASPYHIAYCPALKLRLGPFRRADGRRFPASSPDPETANAISSNYRHLDPWTWKEQLTPEMLSAEWLPGLPNADPVQLIAVLAWLT